MEIFKILLGIIVFVFCFSFIVNVLIPSKITRQVYIKKTEDGKEHCIDCGVEVEKESASFVWRGQINSRWRDQKEKRYYCNEHKKNYDSYIPHLNETVYVRYDNGLLDRRIFSYGEYFKDGKIVNSDGEPIEDNALNLYLKKQGAKNRNDKTFS
jgi:hypothetical protein